MKKVALINDLSGLGRCSLTAAIPVISAMGIQACPLPTAILTAQTGFEDYYCDDYTDRMDQFTEKWALTGERFDGIYSGYLASHKQMEKVKAFLEKFHRPGCLYLADPVLGDNGEKIKIFTDELLDCMRSLVHSADVVTPNLTELCLLTEKDYSDLVSHSGDPDYEERILDLGRELASRAERDQMVVITGIQQGETIGNMAVWGGGEIFLKSPYNGKSYSGTGDLFASVLCGCLLRQIPVREAVYKAMVFLQAAIEDAPAENEDPIYGIPFEDHLHLLID